MSLSIYQYALILLFALTTLYLLRWLLELRFHLHISRVGFFSVTGIRYHPGSESKRKWSINVGNIKTRLKHSTDIASSAWITIHLSDIEIAINNLDTLIAERRRRQRQQQQKRPSNINRRLSNMGDSLKRIPWWYSLSVVKYILKFTSALPAQFVMAGLANYVDVQIDGLTVSLDNVGQICIEQLNFSSILYAAMSRVPPSSSSSIPAATASAAAAFATIPAEPHFTSDSGAENDGFHARRQRHSLKRAEHLFKEKFFEITVHVGHIGFRGADKSTEIWGLPMGSRVAISCHLSAGCLTLKDFDMTIQVDAIQIKLDQLSQLARTIRQQVPMATTTATASTGNSAKHQPPVKKNAAASLLHLIRTLSISISDIALTCETTEGLYTSARLHSLVLSLAAQTVDNNRARDRAALYVIQGDVDLITWSIFNNKPDLATECIEPLHVPKTKISATITEAMLLGSEHSLDQDSNKRRRASGPGMLLSSMALEQVVGNNALTQRFLRVSVTIRDPKFTVDVDKKQLLDSVLRQRSKHSTNDDDDDDVDNKSDSASDARSQSLSDMKVNRWMNKRMCGDLPRVLFAVNIERPLLDFCNSAVKANGHGLITTAGISFEFSGEYIPRTPSIASPPPSPSYDELDEGMRKRRQPKSWVKLFRKSWKPKNPLPQTNLETDWNYHIRAAVKVDSIAVRHGRTVNAKATKEEPLAGLESIDLTARTQLLAEPSSNVQGSSDMGVTWDWENQKNDTDLSIGSPFLNLSSVTAEGQKTIDFWIDRVIRPLSVKHTPSEESATATASKFDVSTFANHIKATMAINNFSVMLAGVDQGVKGKRQVPKQHMDNAPTEDTVVHLHLQLESFSIGFTGAATARSHRRSTSSDSSRNQDDMAFRSRLGKIRGHAYQLTVKKMFQMGTQCEGVSRLLFWCSHINVATDVALEGWCVCLSPAIVAKKCGLVYGIDAHYAVLVILQEAKNIRSTLFRKMLVPEPFQQPQQRGESAKKVSVLKVQLQVNRTDVSFTLPNETKLYLRMDEVRLLHQSGAGMSDTKQQPIVAARNVMLFGLSPIEASKWEQLIELDNIGFSRVHDQGQTINQLAISKLFLRVPYKFAVSNIVDNAVTFTKGLKAMHGRFSGVHPFTYLGPSVSSGPRKVPNMCLKCGTLRLQFDDDPFEARLRMIWRTGLTEQLNRLALDEAFDAKAQTIMQTSNVKETSRQGIDNDQARNHFLSADQPKASSSSSSRTIGENVAGGNESDDTADAHVNEVWQMLQEHNSATWIKHINAAVLQEENDHDKSRISDYSRLGQLNDIYDDDGQNDVASLFLIETLPLPPHPPLFDFTIMNMTLHVSLPDFPLEDTRLFVHQNGKGIPIDTEFTTLMPFRLDWKAGETWAQIRDYPLPMLLVPPPKDEGQVSWSLLGNYVLGDELGSLDATRQITIPIIDTPNCTMDIARTSSPTKFYSIVNIDVHTPDMSTISWSVPYQPAIQDISRTFDSFTRPPVDPSSKIGFWDKIRLIIHTKTKISFVGGGDFAFLMKGTRDPYETSERGFGLAKVWSNDVVWLLGHDNPDREFLQIISRDYAFGVPDLIHGGYTSTYILPRISRPTDPDKQEKQDDNELCAPKRTRTLTSLLTEQRSDPRFVKVALKLTDGIRMGIGCQLERVCPPGCPKCDDNEDIRRVSMYTRSDMARCRFLTFLPHYEVRMKTPRAVQAMGEKAKHYDAYEGFRSNFIHLSISIVKISAEKPDKVDITNATMNSMHLTPGFIDHFVTWFRLFGGAMSYPMRNGALFPRADPRPTKKFGKHMRSMKYKVMLHPLTIGYFYKDQNAVDDKRLEETGDSVGLKALVSAFNVDIHQRREITDVENHKLDQKRLKANWPMHEAEVHLKSIDLRAVRAKYSANGVSSQHSAPSIAVGGLSESSDSSVDPDLMDGMDRFEDEDTGPSDWVDFDDFVELQVLSPDNAPIVQVLPFAYSPCLYYLKQTNRADREKYRYLRNTHNCIMGTAGDTREIQMGIVRQRHKNIDVQIKKHQARIHTVRSKLADQEDEKLQNEVSDAMADKTEILFEKRALLERCLKDLSTQTMPNVSGGNSVSEQDSYSSSTLLRPDSLWEDLMGHFKQRCIVHNPQIIWNNAVRNIVYHFLDVRAHRRALDYYTSMRAVKFLRDLIETSQKERESWKRDSVVMNDDDDTNFDSRMAEELIQKLLAEQHTRFVALNETEEDIEKNKTIDMDMPTGKVNDPETQKNSIPSGYEMKSSYLIDLLHPQISLQSDRDPDSLVIVANERIQVKGFNIFDVNGADVEEMDLVKNRTIVSLDNSQVFVAKKERFDTVDLLFDNHYGAKHTDRWLAWVPPEMLIKYDNKSSQFQRVAKRLAATVQYDKYNQLRFKTNPTAFAQIHPFEDRCDNVHLNIPKLSLNANSSQYNAIFEVVTDLLLYKEPAKKERLARLREIMMAADRNSIDKAIDRIITLQDRVRQLNETYTQYRLNLSHLDQNRVDEFRAIRASKYEHCEELYLGMEAIKLTQQSNTRKNYHEPKTNLKFVFVAGSLLWEMLTDNDAPLCEWNLVNTTYILTSKEDRSSSNTFEVDMLTVKNKTSSPVFTEVLGPYVDPKKTTDFSRHKMLRGYLVDLPPVGGIPVTQHLEVNLYPLRLQMTYEFGKAMASYVFPADRRQKPSSSDTTSSAPRSPVASSNVENEGSSIHHSISSNDIRLLDEPEIVVPVEAQEQAPEMTASLSAPPSGKKGLKNGRRKQVKKSVVDDLSVMRKRASTNRAFLLVKIPGTRHCLSYQGPKEKNIEDLRDFAFQQPNLEYRNKTWSWFELMSIIKKDFLRAAVLHNSTALLKEKLMIRRHPPRERLAESNISMQSNTSHNASDAYNFPDDGSESTDSSNDELDELENDAISLRSVSLYEVDQGAAEPATHTQNTRRLLPWSLKSRKRQVIDSGHPHDDGRNEKRHSIDSMEGRETSSMLDEELTAKGRMLLGKKYNGPIYSFATKPNSKGKRPTTHRTES
ncbi:golgi-body localization protein domain-containing protein [Zychaea mexicana]|uniref:golgi-body localization protein domain-containing protein n=1 Tax=Zychaea mexicana TaxID=64656 RepID=UPI0022FDBD9A|nr:golgi-body localization protein domain-containing protein [Zychaea mexicana]KAI9488532.1 golgi-body localization protein domain-containing protein [Zychaea mexicana]